MKARDAAFSFLLSALIAPAALADGGVRTVVLTGQALPNGDFFNVSATAQLNNRGQVAFAASSALSREFERLGSVWISDADGTLTLTAQRGGSAPNTDNRVFGDILRFAFNDAGQIAFETDGDPTLSYSNPFGLPVEARGIWRRDPNGEVSPIASPDLLPDDPRLAESNTDVLLWNNSGHTGFLGRPVNGSGDAARFISTLYSDATGELLPVARLGQQAPGLPAGYALEFLNSASGRPGRPDLDFWRPTLDELGRVAIIAGATNGADPDSQTRFGVWRGTDESNLAPIALSGSPAPGFHNEVELSRFFRLSASPDGRLAFTSGLQGTGIDETNGFALWREKHDGLTLIAQKGDQAPGVPGGRLFSAFPSSAPRANGETVFGSVLTAPEDAEQTSIGLGIWRHTAAGDLQIVAGPSVLAQGLGEGAEFIAAGHPVVNASGQVAFLASAVDGDGESTFGIWAEDASGAPQLVARNGGLLDVNDDPLVEDLREIEAFHVPQAPPFSPPGLDFNDRGEVAFFARFTDGTSGLFVSSLVAVPEPAAATLIVIVIASAPRRRRS